MLKRFRDDDGYEKWDRWSEWPMVGLAVIFLCALILPLAASLTRSESRALLLLNITLWACFAVEYIVRLYLSADRAQFVRSHILDLLVVIVPFFRPLRLVRIASLVVSSGRRAGGLVVREVTAYVVCVTAVVMSVSALVVYHAERSAPNSNIHSIGDAFWWAVTTATTVGYGDKFPITTTGRVTAVVLMFTGIALVGTITAAVASAFVNIVRGKGSERAIDEMAQSDEHLAGRIDHLSEVVELLRQEIRRRGASETSGDTTVLD